MQSNAEVTHSLVVLRLQAAPRGSSGPLDAMIRVDYIGGKKSTQNLCEVEVAELAMCPCPQDSRLAPSSSCIGIRINLPRIDCSHVKLAHVSNWSNELSGKELGFQTGRFCSSSHRKKTKRLLEHDEESESVADILGVSGTSAEDLATVVRCCLQSPPWCCPAKLFAKIRILSVSARIYKFCVVEQRSQGT